MKLTFYKINKGLKGPKGKIKMEKLPAEYLNLLQTQELTLKQKKAIYSAFKKTVWNKTSIQNASFILQIQAGFNALQAEKIVDYFRV